jgi:hypothetical protein
MLKLAKGILLLLVLAPLVVAMVRLVAGLARVTERRWLGRLLISCAAVLCVWMVVLGLTLPHQVDARHWRAAWIGLDLMEACCLAGTGFLLLKRDLRVGAVAGAAAALLAVDAWFDVTTAQAGADYLLAMAFGTAIELPVATVCAVIAWTAPRRFGLPPP